MMQLETKWRRRGDVKNSLTEKMCKLHDMTIHRQSCFFPTFSVMEILITIGLVDIVKSRESPAAIAWLLLLLLSIYERFTRQMFGSFYSLLLSRPFWPEVVSYIGLPLSSVLDGRC